MVKPLRLAGKRIHGPHAEAGPIATPFLTPALGQQLVGLAAAILVLIPAGAEVFLAGGNIWRAVSIAKVLPPTQLGLEMLPAASPVVVGFVGTLSALYIQWAGYRVRRRLGQPALRDAKTKTIALVQAGVCAPLLLGSLLVWTWAGMLLVLVGLGASLGWVAFLLSSDLNRASRAASGVLAALLLVSLMYLTSGLVPKVVLPGATETQPLLKITADGVWVLDHQRNAVFVELKTSEVVVCGSPYECDLLVAPRSDGPTALPVP